MLRVGSWLYNKSAPVNDSTQSLDALSESQQLENALEAATLIMNDDVDGAEEGLQKGDSSFHKLGRGVVAFVRATLGFEQDIMREASERLNAAETSAYNDHRKAQHNANAVNAYKSSIYAPGTEYILCQSMAQLMAALVGVLNESLTESIKAFYKLRKAYIALDGVMQMEEKYLRAQGTKGDPTSSRTSSEKNSKSSDSSSIRGGSDPGLKEPPSRTDHSKADVELDSAVSALSLSGEEHITPIISAPHLHLTHEPDSEIFANPVDAFVHSGTNLCFGLLLLLISMVPPAFSKLLYIIGFRGDRQRGLRMLWQASKFHTLTGAIAALALLAFYNGFVRCCDVLPDPPSTEEEDIEGYPMQRLTNLLADMRRRFPKSQLWLLEESRMEGAHRRVERALDLLSRAEKSPLKQVEALLVFEKSMDAMYVHDYQLCADSFLLCAELNSWSRALYFYIAGASHLALYRKHAKDSPSLAKTHADKATELFRKAPSQAGKKKFMARQLPFDVLVSRKIAKWEARAKEWNVDFIAAIGVDPLEEMIFHWNGHSRMSNKHLEDSLKNLAWSESAENKMWSRETIDEKAILALLRASILRALRRHEESKKLLESEILCHDRSAFKGPLKDDWTLPTAHYEMASNLWMERYAYQSIHVNKKDGAEKDDQNRLREAHDWEKVQECKKHVEKVAKWESFELDARVGLKVATAQETIRRWEKEHSS
ncbi:hypothetical protein VTO42DRAFT_853 [Malbranchea cinnamomea]